MKLELQANRLSTLIDILEDIQGKHGDLNIGYVDTNSYTNKVILKTTDFNELIFDISK